MGSRGRQKLESEARESGLQCRCALKTCRKFVKCRNTRTSIIDCSGDCVQAKEARSHDLNSIDVNRIDSAGYYNDR